MSDEPSVKPTEDFVRGFEYVAESIRQRNPDIIIAPMRGAVPFIDVLNIVDEHFPNEKVEYVSASSIVHRRNQVLHGSFTNILKAYDFGEPISALSIDEVISGNSLLIVSKQFHGARIEHANSKAVALLGPEKVATPEFGQVRDELASKIQYHSIGIVDLEKRGKIPEKGHNQAYDRLVKAGIVTPVEMKSVLTMDRIGFFPAKYKTGEYAGKRVNLPVVEGVVASPVYINFLKAVAEMVGKDPAKVNVHNIGKITESYKWVPQELCVA